MPGIFQAAQQSTGDVKKICKPARGAAKDEPQVVALQRRSRSQLLQHSAEILDADGHQLRDIGFDGPHPNQSQRTQLKTESWDR